AALRRHAIEIAGLVEDKPAKRIGSVRAACEGVKRLLRPASTRRHHFVNHTIAAAPDGGRAVEVTDLVEGEVAIARASSVSPPREAVNHRDVPRALYRRANSRHRVSEVENVAIGIAGYVIRACAVERAIRADGYST